MEEVLDKLRMRAKAALKYAFVPYSRTPRAAVVLLSDGAWLCGVRIENASHSLVIQAFPAAIAVAVATGRRDIQAVVLSGDARPGEIAYAAGGLMASLTQYTPDAFVASASLPALGERLVLGNREYSAQSASDSIALARSAAAFAWVPESDFPVGCVLVDADGAVYRGANVEHPDWHYTLCAERVALASAQSEGAADPRHLYVSCVKDASGSPCGACRQVMIEKAPNALVWVDRGSAPAYKFAPEELLPASFKLNALHKPD